ncbi:unnamed protein product [Cylicocyclus nassatus]|uniref:Uncharacterized protein n=1 Tax=Cylicocyclus nassatus TaxID=53992 RepID=A0AA36GW25_CYLNA|nr:unnamed protein product [Cylicocyclus nassatus]
MKTIKLSRLYFFIVLMVVLPCSLAIYFANLGTLPVIGARPKEVPCEYRSFVICIGQNMLSIF